jgi:hypothetical protein
MPKIIAQLDLLRPYIEWKKAFDRDAHNRNNGGVKTIYVGHNLENERLVFLLFKVSSMEALFKFTQPTLIRDRAILYGHNPATARVIPCID